MALLGSVQYDPGTAASVSTASLLAMTAVDTTNCRVTFTAPSSGKVLVRIKANISAGATTPVILLGVLEGATVVGRQAPIGGRMSNTTSSRVQLVSEYAVSGVGAGSHSYDLAYAVQTLVTSSVIKYGGPNNTTTNDAWGAITMEVWDASNLLAVANYDPAVAATKATTSLLAMTAFDTTNLRCTFTAPASGNVLVIGRAVNSGSSTFSQNLLGALESATVVARQAPYGGIPQIGTLAATDFQVLEFSQIVTGVGAGSHSYDFAYGNETAVASTNFKYGGPNDATGADAWGMARFEVWSA